MSTTAFPTVKTDNKRKQPTFPSLSRTPTSARHNKIYRCPPTPPPEVQLDRERSFILDCRAVSNISKDYSSANPKLGSVIPPYNSSVDHHAGDFYGRNSAKSRPRITNEPGHRYLSLRNQFGAGHSVEEIRGHQLFLNDPKPVINYNGLFGYRRNTPSLREQPTIGTKKVVGSSDLLWGRYSVVGCGNNYAFHCRCRYDRACRCHNKGGLCRCVMV